MNVYVLRNPHGDGWETFMSQCFEDVREQIVDCTLSDLPDFVAEDARELFRAELERGTSGVLLALCHGTAYGLWRTKSDMLLGVGDGELLRGKFCYLIACSAGAKFGPQALDNGATGFVGFTDDVDVMAYMEREHERLLRSALMAGFSLLLERPATSREVYDALRNALLQAVQTISRERIPGDRSHAYVCVGAMVRMVELLTHG